VDTGVATTGEPPAVRILSGADGESVANLFRDQGWSRTDIYVHVGGDGPERTEPVVVLVLNNGSERSIPVRARHPPSNTTLYDRAPAFAASEALVFVFHEPSSYAVEVGAGEESARVDLRRDDFDCNERTLGVAVQADGRIVSQSLSTMLGCGTL
jgi:hypothetical protein